MPDEVSLLQPTNSCRTIPWVAYDYTELWWSYRAMLFAHHPPPLLGAVVISLLALTIALGGGAYAARKVRQPIDCRRSRLIALDVMRLGSTVQLCLHTIIVAAEGSGQLPAPLQRIGEWGVASFPLFLIISGFTTALRHAETAAETAVWPLLRRAISGYYPTFVATALAGLLLEWMGRGVVFPGNYLLMMPFCAGAWDTALRVSNQANAPSWLVGALLFNTAFALPLCARLQTITPRAMWRIMLFLYVATLWQACNEDGITVLVLDNLVTFLALSPSVPAYVFGLVLGNLHLLHHPTLVHSDSVAGHASADFMGKGSFSNWLQVRAEPPVHGYLRKALLLGLASGHALCTAPFLTD